MVRGPRSTAQQQRDFVNNAAARLPAFPVKPGIVYSRTQISSWAAPASAVAAAALLGSTNGSLTKSFTSPGTNITNRTAALTDSIYALCQAILFKANGNTAHRARCTTVLDAYSGVTQWTVDGALSYRLYASWIVDNMVRAAALIGYRKPAFINGFLLDATLNGGPAEDTVLDHVKNFNWHGTFSAARIAIAAYVGDIDLWDAAKIYCYTRIGQGIYHATYDVDGKVKPCTGTTGSISSTHTVAHWGGEYDVSAKQVLPDYTPVTPPLSNGATAERTHDLGHVSLGLGGYMHALRTIKLQDGFVDAAAYARFLAACGDHAARVLQFIDDGTFLSPAPVDDEGGPEYQQAWLGLPGFFGPDTPTSVTQICALSEVTGYAPAGANHLVAEILAP